MANRWTEEELDLLHKFFNNSWRLPTLAMRIQKVNPDRTFEAISRQVRRYRSDGASRPKERFMDSLRIGYLDIEATNLNANYGYMLCWYIKPKGSNEFDKSVIKKSEIMNHTFDKRIVKELLEAMKKYDILYAHYGADWRYDLPYIRTRALSHGFEELLPKRDQVFIRDTWSIARSKLKLTSNRLDTIAEALYVNDVKKTRLEPMQWIKGQVGDKEALSYIEEHNMNDVIILEKIHDKLKYVENQTLTSI